VTHALATDKYIGEFLHLTGLALHHDDFQTRVVVKTRMNRRNDDRVVMMLNIGQLLRQKTDVVIVDQSDGSHDCPGRAQQLP
jgi:hypothetical protein